MSADCLAARVSFKTLLHSFTATVAWWCEWRGRGGEGAAGVCVCVGESERERARKSESSAKCIAIGRLIAVHYSKLHVNDVNYITANYSNFIDCGKQ